MDRLELRALPGLPMVREGDDLAALIEGGLARADLALQAGDVLVVAQKIVSKAGAASCSPPCGPRRVPRRWRLRWARTRGWSS
jgi:hypothetical protein